MYTEELEDETYTYTFDFKVKKVDVKGAPLANAKFGLYADQAGTQPVKNAADENMEATSGADGKMTFAGLKEGTYYVKEIEAPTANGVKYSLNDKAYQVTIGDAKYDAEGKLTEYTVSGDLGTYVVKVTYTGSGKDAVAAVTYQKGETAGADLGYVGDIPNTPLSELPSTGGMGTYIFIIA